jgi:predicted  nucleic acid-binding Zn-ribbon protein
LRDVAEALIAATTEADRLRNEVDDALAAGRTVVEATDEMRRQWADIEDDLNERIAMLQTKLAEARSPEPGAVPTFLRRALRNAQRAFVEGDYRALGTVNEHLQPLVDAAMARITRAEASARKAENKLAAVERTAQLLQTDVHAQRRAIVESCALLRVTDDSDDDWPKLPEAVASLLAELSEARTRNGDRA